MGPSIVAYPAILGKTVALPCLVPEQLQRFWDELQVCLAAKQHGMGHG
jgi:hypothetical protein